MRIKVKLEYCMNTVRVAPVEVFLPLPWRDTFLWNNPAWCEGAVRKLMDGGQRTVPRAGHCGPVPVVPPNPTQPRFISLFWPLSLSPHFGTQSCHWSEKLSYEIIAMVCLFLSLTISKSWCIGFILFGMFYMFKPLWWIYFNSVKFFWEQRTADSNKKSVPNCKIPLAAILRSSSE